MVKQESQGICGALGPAWAGSWTLQTGFCPALYYGGWKKQASRPAPGLGRLSPGPDGPGQQAQALSIPKASGGGTLTHNLILLQADGLQRRQSGELLGEVPELVAGQVDCLEVMQGADLTREAMQEVPFQAELCHVQGRGERTVRKGHQDCGQQGSGHPSRACRLSSVQVNCGWVLCPGTTSRGTMCWFLPQKGPGQTSSHPSRGCHLGS